MERRTFLISAAVAALSTSTIVNAQEKLAMPEGRHADVNGLKLYYEVHGAGRPLVLLHGGGPNVGVFGPGLPLLVKAHQVILPHLQGHGHTRDIDRPFRYETMADDIAQLVATLGLPRVDVMGYSLGGGVALQMAIRHPQLVDRLILASTAMQRDGSYPEVLAAFDHMDASAPVIAENIKKSPLATMYPVAEWETLFRKMGEMNRLPYDWSPDVAELKAKTMLVFADADSIRPEHMVEFWKAVGGGARDAGLDGSQRPVARLAIIPNTTHYSLLGTPAVAEIVAPFLDAA